MAELRLRAIVQDYGVKAAIALADNSTKFSVKNELFGGAYDGTCSLRQRLLQMLRGRTKFVVARHGFRFSNRNWKTHAIETPFHITTVGRCGGMSYAALDYFYDSTSDTPEVTCRPFDGQVLSTYIYDRLEDSLWNTVSTFYAKVTNLDRSSVYKQSITTEWIILKSYLDDGKPVNLGLIFPGLSVGDNHQVLAVGYSEGTRASDCMIFIYDPNNPGVETILFPEDNRIFKAQTWNQYLDNDKCQYWDGFFVDTLYVKKSPPILSRPCPSLDWSGENHSGQNYDHSDFRDARFMGTNFQGSRLRRVDMDSVDAARADFCGIDAQQSFWGHANLRGAKFNDMNNPVPNDLRLANFINTDLTDATLCHSYANGARFSGSILNGANLYHTELRLANFNDISIDCQLQEKTIRKVNVYSEPSLNEGVVDTLDADTTVFLNARTHDGKWMHFGIPPMPSGWILASHLTTHNDLSVLPRSPVYLIETDLRECDLKHASLQGADLTRAKLYHSDLRDADFQRAILRSADLRQCDLKHASLQGADLTRAKLYHSDLRDADFQRAILRSADLRQCDLKHASLQGADLTRANICADNHFTVLLESTYCKETKFKTVQMRTTNHSKVIFAGDFNSANFNHADLSACDTSMLILSQASFRNADFVGADLSARRTSITDCRSADLRNADFVGADLSARRTSITDCRGADLRNADFRNAKLDADNSSKVDFTNALIMGAKFAGARLDGATLPDGSMYSYGIDLVSRFGASSNP